MTTTPDPPEDLIKARKLLDEFPWTRLLSEEKLYAYLFPGTEATLHLLMDGRVVLLSPTFGTVYESLMMLRVQLSMWEEESQEAKEREKAGAFIEGLPARNIVSAQWTVYRYGDEELVDSAFITTSDGETRQLDLENNPDDNELEDELWRISMLFGQTGNTGVYTLDVPTRTATRVGDATFHYDEEYEGEEVEGDEGSGGAEDGEEHSWVEATELPPDEHRTITL
jgi:hypothetical protein